MNQKELEDMIQELGDISRELDKVQKEITRDIIDKISSIQSLLDALPEDAPGNRREIILEKAVARITVRDNGETVFEGLFDQ